MAIVNKATLKGFFEQGDIPTQGQYFNLIDSTFNLADTDAQVLQGTISASVGDFENLKLKKAFIPGIGVGDAKVGTSFAIGKSLEVMGSMNVNATGSDPGNLKIDGSLTISHITSSTISASKTISSSVIRSHQQIIQYKGVEGGSSIENGFVVGPALTVSGSISSSANLVARNITASNNISASAGVIAQQIKFPNNDNNIQEGSITFKNSGDSGTENAQLYADANGNVRLLSPESIYISIDKGLDSTDDVFVIGDSTFPGVIGSIFFQVDSNSDISQIRNITGSGFITASGAIHSDGNISSSAHVTCSFLFSSDDAEITDDLTVGGNTTVTGTVQAEQLTSTDDINATDNIIAGGNFLGNNMGAIPFSHIPIIPSDLGVGDLSGKDGVMDGTSIKQAASGISLYASYMIPQGMQTELYKYMEIREYKLLL